MEKVEDDRGGNGRIDREWNAGEIDESGDGSGDKGRVAGVLFGGLDEAAEAVVLSADFLLDSFEEDFPEGRLVRGEVGGGSVAVEVQLLEGGLEVLGLL